MVEKPSVPSLTIRLGAVFLAWFAGLQTLIFTLQGGFSLWIGIGEAAFGLLLPLLFWRMAYRAEQPFWPVIISTFLCPVWFEFVSGPDSGMEIWYPTVVIFVFISLIESGRRVDFLWLIAGALMVAVFALTDFPVDISPYYIPGIRTNVPNLLGSGVSAIVLFLILRSQFLTEQQRRKRAFDFRNRIFFVIQLFSNLLSQSKSVEKVLWDVAQRCIPELGLEDFVIYLVDKDRQVLVQKAAYGAKSLEEGTIVAPIEIPIGQGIVGTVAATGRTERIGDTSKDPRYIADDAIRYSEIAVPILVEGEVVGVIDSEHTERDFFSDELEMLMQVVALLIANRIAEEQSVSTRLRSRELELEAENLQLLNEQKTRFVANISHELRTPVSLILTPAEEILDADPPPELRDLTTLIRHNAQRLNRLVSQLLQLNKMRLENNEQEWERIQVAQLVPAWINGFQSHAAGRNITLEAEYGLLPEQMDTDLERLETIFYNLLSNAVKFTPPGGVICVYAGMQQPGVLTFRVQDSGPGISEKDQEQIFERFYQAESGRFEGAGIGLALVKEGLDLLGGEVSLESEPGKGATFTVHIPVPEGAEGAGVPLDRTGGLADDTGKPVLLVVEDNPDMSAFLRNTLSSEYAVVLAADGAEGLEKALEFLPDLIITDLMMPVMTGEELVHALRAEERTDHIPIIGLSAKGQVEDRVSLYEKGADNYLTKPFSSAELKSVIAGLIRQRQKLRERYRLSLSGADTTENPDSPETRFLRKAYGVLQEHLDDPDFNVAILGEALGLNRNQLQRKVKALTGEKPSEFIRNYRLSLARKKILAREGNVSEIAWSVGFNNLSYFSKTFRELFGESPSDMLK